MRATDAACARSPRPTSAVALFISARASSSVEPSSSASSCICVVELDGLVVGAAVVRGDADVVEHRGAAHDVVGAVERREAATPPVLRAGDVAAVEGDVAEEAQGRRHRGRIAELLADAQRLAVLRLGDVVVAAGAGEVAGAVEQVAAQVGALAGGEGERAVEPAASLAEVAVRAPERAERRGEVQERVDLAGAVGPVERDADVVVVVLEHAEPALHLRRPVLGRPARPGRSTSRACRAWIVVGLVRRLEVLVGVLAHGREHDEASGRR